MSGIRVVFWTEWTAWTCVRSGSYVWDFFKLLSWYSSAEEASNRGGKQKFLSMKRSRDIQWAERASRLTYNWELNYTLRTKQNTRISFPPGGTGSLTVAGRWSRPHAGVTKQTHARKSDLGNRGHTSKETVSTSKVASVIKKKNCIASSVRLVLPVSATFSLHKSVTFLHYLSLCVSSYRFQSIILTTIFQTL